MRYFAILLVLLAGCSVAKDRVKVEAYAITEFPQPDTDVTPVAPLNASQPRSVSGTLIITESPVAAAANRVVYIATIESCAPCQSWKREPAGELTKRFVDIEKPKPDDISKQDWDVIKSKVDQVPRAWFKDKTGTIRLMPVGKFSDWQLNWSMDKADEEATNHPVASATMGTIIDAGDSVKMVMDEWEQKLGSGTSIQITYDRSGEQTGKIIGGTFPSLRQLAGNLGRITADTDAPIAFKNISVGYRVFTDAAGAETVRFDIDPLTFNISNKASSSGEVGIIPVFTIIQVASGLWQLFHPVCTVEMPGTVRLKATLNNRVITVNLETMPSIHFNAWFISINPKLSRVEVGESSARLLFTGSVIKERTFKYSNMNVGGSSDELPTGWHSHKCDSCGHIWKHQNGLANWVDGIDITKEHTCAKCGREQWEQYDWNPK